MVDKIHGMVNKGQNLTGSLDTYTIRTTLDIRPTGVLADASQDRLNKLIEVISLRAQPVIRSAVKTSTETNPSDIPSAVGSVTVYTLTFSTEHRGAWELGSSPNPSLAETLDGVAGFVFDVANTASNNVAVALTQQL